MNDSSVSPLEDLYIAGQHSESIEHLYRTAIDKDPSPRNLIAYGCYLAEHGRYLEAFHEFECLLADEAVATNPSLLAEIVYRISRIETQLEDDALMGQSDFGTFSHQQHEDNGQQHEHNRDGEFEGNGRVSRENSEQFAEVVRQLVGEAGPQDLGGLMSGLNHQMLQEVGDLLTLLWTDRQIGERRRTGLMLLKLALFSGRHNWCEIEVACIQKAIQCFEQAIEDIQSAETLVGQTWSNAARKSVVKAASSR